MRDGHEWGTRPLIRQLRSAGRSGRLDRTRWRGREKGRCEGCIRRVSGFRSEQHRRGWRGLGATNRTGCLERAGQRQNGARQIKGVADSPEDEVGGCHATAEAYGLFECEGDAGGEFRVLHDVPLDATWPAGAVYMRLGGRISRSALCASLRPSAERKRLRRGFFLGLRSSDRRSPFAPT